MDLYEFLTSATDAQALKSRVDALCKGRAFGESLTPSMLHCMLGALENGNGDFAADVAAINEEIQVLEDLPSINERKRAYGIHLLMEKTKLPLPAKMLIATGFLRTPLNAAGRAAPSKFTFTRPMLRPPTLRRRWRPRGRRRAPWQVSGAPLRRHDIAAPMPTQDDGQCLPHWPLHGSNRYTASGVASRW